VNQLAGFGESWPRERDFWLLWLVGFAMYAVRFIEVVAFSVFVYQRDGSPLLVATVMLLRLLPMGLLSAVLGVVTERLERRSALMIVLSTMLTTASTLAVLSLSDALETWHLAIASVVAGVGWATDNPVRRMMIGEVVGGQRLARAMALDIASNNVCRMAGPIIGGFMLAWAGISFVFVAGSLLYLSALLAAWRLRCRSEPTPQTFRMAFSRLTDGIRIGITDPRLRAILILSLISSIFGWPYSSMIPVIGQDHLGLDAAGIGILTGMEGVGAFITIIAIGGAATFRQHGTTFIVGTFIYQFACIAFALAPEPISAAMLVLAGGLGNAACAITQTTLAFTTVPPDMRARTLGVVAACNGSGVIGFLLIGVLADAIGARAAVIIFGFVGLAALLLTIPYWRVLRE
jgi:MFS family permease